MPEAKSELHCDIKKCSLHPTWCKKVPDIHVLHVVSKSVFCYLLSLKRLLLGSRKGRKRVEEMHGAATRLQSAHRGKTARREIYAMQNGEDPGRFGKKKSLRTTGANKNVEVGESADIFRSDFRVPSKDRKSVA